MRKRVERSRFQPLCFAAAVLIGCTAVSASPLAGLQTYALESEEAEETEETETAVPEPTFVLPGPEEEEEEELIIPPAEEPEGDPGALAPLVEAINKERTAQGSETLKVETMLMDIAEQRVGEFERNPEEHASPVRASNLSSETVIRGKADPNTVLCAILLSERQCSNLVYSGYKKIGLAVNETEDIWVILLSS